MIAFPGGAVRPTKSAIGYQPKFRPCRRYDRSTPSNRRLSAEVRLRPDFVDCTPRYGRSGRGRGWSLVGRVGMWRGGVRVDLSVSAPFVWRCLTTRRLQPFRHLRDCSGCFRLERWPGGPCTHWKAPPYHGAHPYRTLLALHLGWLLTPLCLPFGSPRASGHGPRAAHTCGRGH